MSEAEAPNQIALPELCLVVLVGATSSGKSEFARRHFKPTEVISSDHCRALVSDDENDQSATTAAFELVDAIATKRLQRRLLTVIDATSVQPFARKQLLHLAKTQHVFCIAIVLDLPLPVLLERNRARPERNLPEQVVQRQARDLHKSLALLKKEGFRAVHVLDSQAAIDAVTLTRTPLWNNRTADRGPFDIIGDVHGCIDELRALLGQLGYATEQQQDQTVWRHPQGRRAFFVGDLGDRGPDTPAVFRVVMNMVRHGTALCVPGNHDVKLLKWLQGKNVKMTHGLDRSVAQFEQESPAFKAEVAEFIDRLISHYVLDDGKLVVAHAGLKEALQGRSSGGVREFCLYGETTGEIDEYGLPVRANWALEYRGKAMVVHGHTPVPAPVWLNNTVCIDTGCVFGGSLTALRYPERETVSVPAAQIYFEPMRPLVSPAPPRSELSLQDVMGRRTLETRLGVHITLNERDAAAGLEAMSRFAVDPRWLVYLPPTMSPCETAPAPEPWLEHPREALAYYRNQGLTQVVCQEKHMGSRAVVVLAKSGAAALERFGIDNPGHGVVVTRTGRPFFADAALQTELLLRLTKACETAGLWQELATDWMVLDCELLPWSAKAQELLRRQYASTGAAGEHALQVAVEHLGKLTSPEGQVLRDRYATRLADVQAYRQAYRGYCWPTEGLQGIQLAPFHFLASAGAVHTDKDHLWHMALATRLRNADPELLMATRHMLVDLDNPQSCQAAIDGWMEATAAGAEGMVVKPLQWMAQGKKGYVQPAVKCRGKEYLRIIYGPEYLQPEHLERLRARNLHGKRGLAWREFALGVEGLHRFVAGEPLSRVHECVFAVLALEAEPVDPRL